MASQESTLRLGVDSRPMVQGLKKGEAALDRTGKKAKGLGGTFDKLVTRTGALKAAFAGLAAIGVGAIFSKAIREAATFETKITEISTLVDTTSFKLDRLTASIEAASVAFGSDAATQAAAAYQIVSAGASSASEATELLNAANRLAVGGVTDVATAADGLTSVLNAYGFSASQASDVSDALFTGVKAGKTTVDELSRSLGKVAPLAAASGVSFDELVGSVAALTKGGISTTESVTGVRAILAAVTKPTKEASDLAAQLGIDFSAAGLEAQGFQGFLKQVTEATGGSTDAMAKLFGGVEAIIPAVALAGQAGVDLNAILEDMETKGGATAEAFEKMTNTFEFQAGRVRQGLNQALRELGSVITSILTPVLRVLADNMESVIMFTKVFATLLTAALLPSLVKLGPVIAGLATRFALFSAALLANPIGLVIAAVAALSAAIVSFGNSSVSVSGQIVTGWQVIRALFMTLSQIFNDVWDVAVQAFTGVANAVKDAFAFVGSLFPGFLGNWDVTFGSVSDIVKTVVNAIIGFHVGMVQAIVNIITTGIPAAFKRAFAAVRNTVADAIDGILNAFGGAGAKAAEFLGFEPNTSGLRQEVQGLNNDLATSFDVIGTVSNAMATDYIGAVDTATGFTSRFKDNLNSLNMEGQDLQTNAATLSETSLPTLGTAIEDLGNKAGGAGSGGATDKLKELNDELARPQTLAEGVQDAWKKIGDSIKTEGEIVSSALQDVFGGVSDAIVEFAKTGKLNFKELAASVAASVLKMTTELLLFKAISALFPGLGGIGGFADGGLVQKFAAGGFVSGKGGPRDDKVPAMLSNGEFVVNAAATRKFGPLLQQLNNGTLGMRMAEGGLASANGNVSLAANTPAPPAQQQGAGGQAPQIQVVSTISDSEVAQSINNPNGEQVILNMLARNKNQLQGIVNG